MAKAWERPVRSQRACPVTDPVQQERFRLVWKKSLKDLDDECTRNIVVLAGSGWKQFEISELLGVSLSTVERRLRRGRRVLEENMRLMDLGHGNLKATNEEWAPKDELEGEVPDMSRRRRIHRPPGFKLQAFADFFFSRKTYEIVLEPVLRDLQDEHIEALAEDQLWKARWVRIRGTWSFWAAALAQTPLSVVKWVLKLWKAV